MEALRDILGWNVVILSIEATGIHTLSSRLSMCVPFRALTMFPQAFQSKGDGELDKTSRTDVCAATLEHRHRHGCLTTVQDHAHTRTQRLSFLRRRDQLEYPRGRS